MIGRYYIPCELWKQNLTTDDMGVQVVGTYSKDSDIKGVVIKKSIRRIVGDQYHYVETPIFLTNDVVSKLDRVVYKGITYEVSSDPEDIMERGHHYEMTMEAVV